MMCDLIVFFSLPWTKWSFCYPSTFVYLRPAMCFWMYAGSSGVRDSLGENASRRRWVWLKIGYPNEWIVKKNTLNKHEQKHILIYRCPYAPRCWNIYQHFPSKSPRFVGKYTIPWSIYGMPRPRPSIRLEVWTWSDGDDHSTDNFASGSMPVPSLVGANWIKIGFVWKCWVNIPNEIAI